MSTQGKLAIGRTGEGKASHPTDPATLAPPRRLAPAPLYDPLLQKTYRDLTRKHLNSLFHRLFAEFTGLHFRVAWAPSLPHRWTALTLPTGFGVCRRLAAAGHEVEEHCRACGSRHLARALRATSRGHWFVCDQGVRNYWVPISVRGVTVGIAYLQSPAGNRSRNPVRRDAKSARIRVVAPSKFHRAGRLLRLVVQHVQTLDLAELRKADLTITRQTVTALENEQLRLRKELGRVIPLTSRTPLTGVPGNHREQVVGAALAFVHERYSQPVTLKQCALSLGLNAAYLSALFSRSLRLPFKTYLTELRLEKAKELLRDLSRNISAIAQAAGYTSENRFRLAFKKATGLSPRTWRETFHAAAPFILTWLVGELELVDRVGALV